MEESNEERPLRMSDLVRITGLPRSTIHYYLNAGLLSPPQRTGKTMAYYGAAQVEELQRIKSLQEEGYPIRLIRKMIAGPQGRTGAAVGKSAAGGMGATPAESAVDPAGRKQQIIDAAVQIFSRVGYHQAKVGDITQAVGVGISTFYLYFPSKKALFMECLDRVFQAMFLDVVEEIKTEEDPLQRLRVRAAVVLKSHTQFLDILQVLRGSFEDDPRLERKRKEIYSLILEPLKMDLEEAIRDGIFPALDVEAVGYMLMGLLETASLILTLKGDYSVDDLLDMIGRLVFYR